MKDSSTFLLVACCLAAGVHSSLVWPFSDPFENLFHRTGTTKEDATTSHSVEPLPKPVTTQQKTPADKPSESASTSKSLSETSSVDLRKLVDEELKKYQASTNDKSKKDFTPVDNGKTTENPADLLRRIVAEELAKALPQTPATTPAEPEPQPSGPLWKQWANTKKWAKQPGPNGQEAPGFLGTLRQQYGGSFGYRGGDASPTGSPKWVWSQIAYKYPSKDPTAVPPTQMVDNGAWETLLPPKKPSPVKT